MVLGHSFNLPPFRMNIEVGANELQFLDIRDGRIENVSLGRDRLVILKHQFSEAERGCCPSGDITTVRLSNITPR